MSELKSEDAQFVFIYRCNLMTVGWPFFLICKRRKEMTTPERNIDNDFYDDLEETFREQDPEEDDYAYFPLEESKPPHY